MAAWKAHILWSDTNADDQSCNDDDQADPLKERVSGKDLLSVHDKRIDAEDREKICVKRIAQTCHADDAKRAGQTTCPYIFL
jgi:hypothetical protein